MNAATKLSKTHTKAPSRNLIRSNATIAVPQENKAFKLTFHTEDTVDAKKEGSGAKKRQGDVVLGRILLFGPLKDDRPPTPNFDNK